MPLRQAVGLFLSEGYAMCDTLRLAFFSRCELFDTGVVSALLEACQGMAWPGAESAKPLRDPNRLDYVFI